MKKIIKCLAALTLLVMLFSCDPTLWYNNVYIENNTGYTILYLYVIPSNEYDPIFSSNYSEIASYYYQNFDNWDILASNEYLYDGFTKTVNLNNYSDSTFKIIADTGSKIYVQDMDSFDTDVYFDLNNWF